MYVTTLLADPTCLRLERILSATALITLVIRTAGPSAACPQCGTSARRVHSRYVRRVADLPWHGVSVRLELHARKFFCPSDGCPQRIFTERLPRVVAAHARRTVRLNEEALTLLGFALGGEAGARAAVGLGMAVGPDTLLARVSRRPLAPPEELERDARTTADAPAPLSLAGGAGPDDRAAVAAAGHSGSAEAAAHTIALLSNGDDSDKWKAIEALGWRNRHSKT